MDLQSVNSRVAGFFVEVPPGEVSPRKNPVIKRIRRAKIERRPFACGHDPHFLRRLDRLSTAHVELALALYRDHELIKALLAELQVKGSVRRVAIAIGDRRRGPFMLVARDEHFVTCLGEGMRVGGVPVVTQVELNRIAKHLKRPREPNA